MQALALGKANNYNSSRQLEYSNRNSSSSSSSSSYMSSSGPGITDQTKNVLQHFMNSFIGEQNKHIAARDEATKQYFQEIQATNRDRILSAVDTVASEQKVLYSMHLYNVILFVFVFLLQQ